MNLCLFSKDLSISLYLLSKELVAGYPGSRFLSCPAVIMRGRKSDSMHV